MSNIYDMFKTDKKLENEGVWIDYGEAGKFLIARIGISNKEYTRKVKEIARKNKKAIEYDILSAEKNRELLIDVFAETVLKDWQNVRDESNVIIEFSHESAKKLLNELPDLFDDLSRQAQDIEIFKAKRLEDDIKN